MLTGLDPGTVVTGGKVNCNAGSKRIQFDVARASVSDIEDEEVGLSAGRLLRRPLGSENFVKVEPAGGS